MASLLLYPLRAYLASLIRGYLADWLDTSDLQLDDLGLFGSELVLRNVALRVARVQAVIPSELGMRLVRGSLQSLRIAIPWTALLSAPIVVRIAGLHVEVEAVDVSDGADAAEVAAARDRSPVAALPAAAPVPTPAAGGSSGVGAGGWLQARLASILANVQVRLDSLVVVLRMRTGSGSPPPDVLSTAAGDGPVGVRDSIQHELLLSVGNVVTWAADRSDGWSPAFLDPAATVPMALAEADVDVGDGGERGGGEDDAAGGGAAAAPAKALNDAVVEAGHAQGPRLWRAAFIRDISVECSTRRVAITADGTVYSPATVPAAVAGSGASAALGMEQPLLSRTNIYVRFTVPLGASRSDSIGAKAGSVSTPADAPRQRVGAHVRIGSTGGDGCADADGGRANARAVEADEIGPIPLLGTGASGSDVRPDIEFELLCDYLDCSVTPGQVQALHTVVSLAGDRVAAFVQAQRAQRLALEAAREQAAMAVASTPLEAAADDGGSHWPAMSALSDAGALEGISVAGAFAGGEFGDEREIEGGDGKRRGFWSWLWGSKDGGEEGAGGSADGSDGAGTAGAAGSPDTLGASPAAGNEGGARQRRVRARLLLLGASLTLLADSPATGDGQVGAAAQYARGHARSRRSGSRSVIGESSVPASRRSDSAGRAVAGTDGGPTALTVAAASSAFAPSLHPPSGADASRGAAASAFAHTPIVSGGVDTLLGAAIAAPHQTPMMVRAPSTASSHSRLRSRRIVLVPVAGVGAVPVDMGDGEGDGDSDSGESCASTTSPLPGTPAASALAMQMASLSGLDDVPPRTTGTRAVNTGRRSRRRSDSIPAGIDADPPLAHRPPAQFAHAGGAGATPLLLVHFAPSDWRVELLQQRSAAVDGRGRAGSAGMVAAAGTEVAPEPQRAPAYVIIGLAAWAHLGAVWVERWSRRRDELWVQLTGQLRTALMAQVVGDSWRLDGDAVAASALARSTAGGGLAATAAASRALLPGSAPPSPPLPTASPYAELPQLAGSGIFAADSPLRLQDLVAAGPRAPAAGSPPARPFFAPPLLHRSSSDARAAGAGESDVQDGDGLRVAACATEAGSMAEMEATATPAFFPTSTLWLSQWCRRLDPNGAATGASVTLPSASLPLLARLAFRWSSETQDADVDGGSEHSVQATLLVAPLRASLDQPLALALRPWLSELSASKASEREAAPSGSRAASKASALSMAPHVHVAVRASWLGADVRLGDVVTVRQQGMHLACTGSSGEAAVAAVASAPTPSAVTAPSPWQRFASLRGSLRMDLLPLTLAVGDTSVSVGPIRIACVRENATASVQMLLELDNVALSRLADDQAQAAPVVVLQCPARGAPAGTAPGPLRAIVVDVRISPPVRLQTVAEASSGAGSASAIVSDARVGMQVIASLRVNRGEAQVTEVRAVAATFAADIQGMVARLRDAAGLQMARPVLAALDDRPRSAAPSGGNDSTSLAATQLTASVEICAWQLHLSPPQSHGMPALASQLALTTPHCMLTVATTSARGSAADSTVAASADELAVDLRLALSAMEGTFQPAASLPRQRVLWLDREVVVRARALVPLSMAGNLESPRPIDVDAVIEPIAVAVHANVGLLVALQVANTTGTPSAPPKAASTAPPPRSAQPEPRWRLRHAAFTVERTALALIWQASSLSAVRAHVTVDDVRLGASEAGADAAPPSLQVGPRHQQVDLRIGAINVGVGHEGLATGRSDISGTATSLLRLLLASDARDGAAAAATPAARPAAVKLTAMLPRAATQPTIPHSEVAPSRIHLDLAPLRLKIDGAAALAVVIGVRTQLADAALTELSDEPPPTATLQPTTPRRDEAPGDATKRCLAAMEPVTAVGAPLGPLLASESDESLATFSSAAITVRLAAITIAARLPVMRLPRGPASAAALADAPVLAIDAELRDLACEGELHRAARQLLHKGALSIAAVAVGVGAVDEDAGSATLPLARLEVVAVHAHHDRTIVSRLEASSSGTAALDIVGRGEIRVEAVRIAVAVPAAMSLAQRISSPTHGQHPLSSPPLASAVAASGPPPASPCSVTCAWTSTVALGRLHVTAASLLTASGADGGIELAIDDVSGRVQRRTLAGPPLPARHMTVDGETAVASIGRVGCNLMGAAAAELLQTSAAPLAPDGWRPVDGGAAPTSPSPLPWLALASLLERRGSVSAPASRLVAVRVGNLLVDAPVLQLMALARSWAPPLSLASARTARPSARPRAASSRVDGLQQLFARPRGEAGGGSPRVCTHLDIQLRPITLRAAATHDAALLACLAASLAPTRVRVIIHADDDATETAVALPHPSAIVSCAAAIAVDTGLQELSIGVGPAAAPLLRLAEPAPALIQITHLLLPLAVAELGATSSAATTARQPPSMRFPRVQAQAHLNGSLSFVASLSALSTARAAAMALRRLVPPPSSVRPATVIANGAIDSAAEAPAQDPPAAPFTPSTRLVLLRDLLSPRELGTAVATFRPVPPSHADAGWWISHEFTVPLPLSLSGVQLAATAAATSLPPSPFLRTVATGTGSAIMTAIASTQPTHIQCVLEAAAPANGNDDEDDSWIDAAVTAAHGACATVLAPISTETVATSSDNAVATAWADATRFTLLLQPTASGATTIAAVNVVQVASPLTPRASRRWRMRWREPCLSSPESLAALLASRVPLFEGLQLQHSAYASVSTAVAGSLVLAFAWAATGSVVPRSLVPHRVWRLTSVGITLAAATVGAADASTRGAEAAIAAVVPAMSTEIALSLPPFTARGCDWLPSTSGGAPISTLRLAASSGVRITAAVAAGTTMQPLLTLQSPRLHVRTSSPLVTGGSNAVAVRVGAEAVRADVDPATVRHCTRLARHVSAAMSGTVHTPLACGIGIVNATGGGLAMRWHTRLPRNSVVANALGGAWHLRAHGPAAVTVTRVVHWAAAETAATTPLPPCYALQLRASDALRHCRHDQYGAPLEAGDDDVSEIGGSGDDEGAAAQRPPDWSHPCIVMEEHGVAGAEVATIVTSAHIATVLAGNDGTVRRGFAPVVVWSVPALSALPWPVAAVARAVARGDGDGAQLATAFAACERVVVVLTCHQALDVLRWSAASAALVPQPEMAIEAVERLPAPLLFGDGVDTESEGGSISGIRVASAPRTPGARRGNDASGPGLLASLWSWATGATSTTAAAREAESTPPRPARRTASHGYVEPRIRAVTAGGSPSDTDGRSRGETGSLALFRASVQRCAPPGGGGLDSWLQCGWAAWASPQPFAVGGGDEADAKESTAPVLVRLQLPRFATAVGEEPVEMCGDDGLRWTLSQWHSTVGDAAGDTAAHAMSVVPRCIIAQATMPAASVSTGEPLAGRASTPAVTTSLVLAPLIVRSYLSPPVVGQALTVPTVVVADEARRGSGAAAAQHEVTGGPNEIPSTTVVFVPDVIPGFGGSGGGNRWELRHGLPATEAASAMAFLRSCCDLPTAPDGDSSPDADSASLAPPTLTALLATASDQLVAVRLAGAGGTPSFVMRRWTTALRGDGLSMPAPWGLLEAAISGAVTVVNETGTALRWNWGVEGGAAESSADWCLQPCGGSASLPLPLAAITSLPTGPAVRVQLTEDALASQPPAGAAGSVAASDLPPPVLVPIPPASARLLGASNTLPLLVPRGAGAPARAGADVLVLQAIVSWDWPHPTLARGDPTLRLVLRPLLTLAAPPHLLVSSPRDLARWAVRPQPPSDAPEAAPPPSQPPIQVTHELVAVDAALLWRLDNRIVVPLTLAHRHDLHAPRTFAMAIPAAGVVTACPPARSGGGGGSRGGESRSAAIRVLAIRSPAPSTFATWMAAQLCYHASTRSAAAASPIPLKGVLSRCLDSIAFVAALRQVQWDQAVRILVTAPAATSSAEAGDRSGEELRSTLLLEASTLAARWLDPAWFADVDAEPGLRGTLAASPAPRFSSLRAAAADYTASPFTSPPLAASDIAAATLLPPSGIGAVTAVMDVDPAPPVRLQSAVPGAAITLHNAAPLRHHPGVEALIRRALWPIHGAAVARWQWAMLQCVEGAARRANTAAVAAASPAASDTFSARAHHGVDVPDGVADVELWLARAKAAIAVWLDADSGDGDGGGGEDGGHEAMVAVQRAVEAAIVATRSHHPLALRRRDPPAGAPAATRLRLPAWQQPQHGDDGAGGFIGFDWAFLLPLEPPPQAPPLGDDDAATGTASGASNGSVHALSAPVGAAIDGRDVQSWMTPAWPLYWSGEGGEATTRAPPSSGIGRRPRVPLVLAPLGHAHGRGLDPTAMTPYAAWDLAVAADGDAESAPLYTDAQVAGGSVRIVFRRTAAPGVAAAASIATAAAHPPLAVHALAAAAPGGTQSLVLNIDVSLIDARLHLVAPQAVPQLASGPMWQRGATFSRHRALALRLVVDSVRAGLQLQGGNGAAVHARIRAMRLLHWRRQDSSRGTVPDAPVPSTLLQVASDADASAGSSEAAAVAITLQLPPPDKLPAATAVTWLPLLAVRLAPLQVFAPAAHMTALATALQRQMVVSADLPRRHGTALASRGAATSRISRFAPLLFIDRLAVAAITAVITAELQVPLGDDVGDASAASAAAAALPLTMQRSRLALSAVEASGMAGAPLRLVRDMLAQGIADNVANVAGAIGSLSWLGSPLLVVDAVRDSAARLRRAVARATQGSEATTGDVSADDAAALAALAEGPSRWRRLAAGVGGVAEAGGAAVLATSSAALQSASILLGAVAASLDAATVTASASSTLVGGDAGGGDTVILMRLAAHWADEAALGIGSAGTSVQQTEPSPSPYSLPRLAALPVIAAVRLTGAAVGVLAGIVAAGVGGDTEARSSAEAAAAASADLATSDDGEDAMAAAVPTAATFIATQPPVAPAAGSSAVWLPCQWQVGAAAIAAASTATAGWHAGMLVAAAGENPAGSTAGWRLAIVDCSAASWAVVWEGQAAAVSRVAEAAASPASRQQSPQLRLWMRMAARRPAAMATAAHMHTVTVNPFVATAAAGASGGGAGSVGSGREGEERVLHVLVPAEAVPGTEAAVRVVAGLLA